MVFSHRHGVVGLESRFLLVLFLVAALEAQAKTPTPVSQRRLLGSTATKIDALEDTILTRINREFRRTKSPLVSDPRLKNFARRYATLAAQGQITSEIIPQRLHARRLGRFGYHFQFVAGTHEREILDAIRRNKTLMDYIRRDFARAGVGVFHAPAEPPFFQVMIILAKDPDPRTQQPGLTTLQTDKVMSAASVEMRDRCYQEVLERDPNFSGHALLELTINNEGTVGDVKLLNTLGDDVMDRCIQEVVGKLTFPKPSNALPVTLRHPMRFTPPQGQPVVGKLTDGQIRATFARSAAEFRDCHQRRLQALGRSQLNGRITLALKVDSTGRVREAGATENTTFDEALRQCVVTHARTLRFPEPQYGGSVEVVFPLDFGG